MGSDWTKCTGCGAEWKAQPQVLRCGDCGRRTVAGYDARITALESALAGLVGEAEHCLRATRLDGPRTRALVKRIDRAKEALDAKS